jgi:hypothetical protein
VAEPTTVRNPFVDRIGPRGEGSYFISVATHGSSLSNIPDSRSALWISHQSNKSVSHLGL